MLATSLATGDLTRAFGESDVALATLVMTALVLIFSEELPKTYAPPSPTPTRREPGRPPPRSGAS